MVVLLSVTAFAALASGDARSCLPLGEFPSGAAAVCACGVEGPTRSAASSWEAVFGSRDRLFGDAEAAGTRAVSWIGRQEAEAGPPSGTGGKALLAGLATDFRRLPSRANVWPAVAGVVATVACLPLDDAASRWLSDEDLDEFFGPGRIIGYPPLQAAVAGMLWAAGRLEDRPAVARLGIDLLRAHAVTGALTYALQFTIRRERPDGTDIYAFPSGHSSITFTTAAVLHRRLGWRVGIPMYVVGAYVAASRVHENRHHLSDVVAGAALGLVVGATVTRQHAPRWHVTVSPRPGGLAVRIVRRSPSR